MRFAGLALAAGVALATLAIVEMSVDLIDAQFSSAMKKKVEHTK